MNVAETKVNFAPSRVVNGMVEAGLVSTNLLLGLCGLSWWVSLVMMAVAILWWTLVHRNRLIGMVRASWGQTVANVALAVVLIGLGHGLGFGFGAALHALIG